MMMCGPFAAACARPAAGLAAWHAGRLLSYAALGAAAGAASAILPGPAWVPALLAVVFLVVFAAALAGLVPEPRIALPGLAAAARLLREGRGPASRLGFGLVNGLIPCGLVYSALSIPVALAHPLPGAAAMLAFGAGTLPAVSIAAAGLRRFTPASLAARRVLAAFVLAAGLWSIGMRIGWWGSQQHAAPATGYHPHS